MPPNSRRPAAASAKRPPAAASVTSSRRETPRERDSHESWSRRSAAAALWVSGAGGVVIGLLIGRSEDVAGGRALGSAAGARGSAADVRVDVDVVDRPGSAVVLG